MTMEKVATKHCNRCKETRPTSDYYKNKYTKSGLYSICKYCKTASNKAWVENNPEKAKKVITNWKEKNPDKLKATRKSWLNKNKDKINQQSREWRKANPEKFKAAVSRWAKFNRDKCRAHMTKRRARKLNATPPWLTEDHLKSISDIYLHARDCELVSGESYHVDHIVPLQGKNVCGLHVPWNLQVLPSDLNVIKGNRHVV